MDTFVIDIDLGLRKDDCSLVTITDIYTEDVGYMSTCVGVDAYLEDSDDLIREPKLLTQIVAYINTYEIMAVFQVAEEGAG